jgi:hypothetical protein
MLLASKSTIHIRRRTYLKIEDFVTLIRANGLSSVTGGGGGFFLRGGPSNFGRFWGMKIDGGLERLGDGRGAVGDGE